MQLIVISNPVPIVDEAKIINSLFERGLEYFHLRKPHYLGSDFVELLEQIDPEYYPRIALHQFHERAADYGIKRLHFPEYVWAKLGHRDFKANYEKSYRLSTSVHTLSELYRLEHVDYVFLSPVFNSLSKPGYCSAIDPNFKVDDEIKVKTIALGGVTAENIEQTIAMNFDGAAVLGTIWNDPLNALKNFNDLMNITTNENHR
jgi:thiamine-phosphate pyrophosphorylase